VLDSSGIRAWRDHSSRRRPRSFQGTLRELGLAQGSPEVGDPAKLGRRAALVAVAVAVWTRHLGPLFDARQVQELLGVGTRQAVNDLRVRRRLLGLPKEGGRVVYPAFQFGYSGRPFDALPRILETFETRAHIDPWTIASWFVTPQALDREGAESGLARMVEAEPERASLAVPADAPPLPQVNDLSTELVDPVQRRFHVRDGEVWERYPVAGSCAPRVKAERGIVSAGLPAFPFVGCAFPELDTQEPGPKAARPGHFVGRKLHESDRGRHYATIADVALELPAGGPSAPVRDRSSLHPGRS
jgi:hypothetical protein